ncbi:GntR family transcriptional regulator [Spirosoma areae]
MTDQLPRMPLYQHLYEMLRQQITKGVYQEGELLPTEKELQNTYKVTQPTVRQALSMLVNDGYIKKVQGRGSTVLPLPVGLGILSIEGRLANSDSQKLKLNTYILREPQYGPFPEIISLLPTQEQIEAGFIFFERIRKVEEDIVFYEKVFIPNINLPGFLNQNLNDCSFFDLLRTKYKLFIKGGEQKIWAVAADPIISEILKVSPGSPIQRLEKRTDTNRLNFSIYSSLFASTDKYLLHGVF